MSHRESSDDRSRPAEVIDRDRLARATGGQPSIMNDLLDMLRRELPARMRQLEAAFESGDPEAAAHVAHKLHGAAAYTGAHELERAAMAFGELPENVDRETRERARVDLEEAVRTLQRALESEDPFNA